MSVERKLDAAHKLTAKVSGQLALALVRKRLPRGQLDGWQKSLIEASEILKEISSGVK